MKALILPAAVKTIILCPDGDTEGARLPDPTRMRDDIEEQMH